MNEGFGFFIEGIVDKAFSIDFLAVGTNPSQSYDYVRDTDTFESWHHDYEHLLRAERLNYDKIRFQKRTLFIANLRNAINRIADETINARTELAFFMLYHESQKSILNAGEEISSRIELTAEKIDQEEIEPDEDGFDSIEQYETYVKTLKSLRIDDTGETIIDKYKCFLNHLCLGYIELEDIIKNL